jgi:2-polyprenyl-3-methyl-5-hydroxy-6-metoxy-1,4-benzoquinol methylase
LSSHHWSKLSKNPVAPLTQNFVSEQLLERFAGPIPDLRKFWEESLTGKTLLDVGVVEHSLEFFEREGWKHGIFFKLAARTVGVDIMEDEVRFLNEKGYDVRLCDATSDTDLGERFEAIYIGDVIEHVNDPIRLLQFAKRHLGLNGKIYVTTPCPFWWRNIALMVKDHTFIGNVDHMRWITPVNALEMGHRANLKLAAYKTLETDGSELFRKILLKMINAVLGRTEFFTWSYVYIFEWPED